LYREKRGSYLILPYKEDQGDLPGKSPGEKGGVIRAMILKEERKEKKGLDRFPRLAEEKKYIARIDSNGGLWLRMMECRNRGRQEKKSLQKKTFELSYLSKGEREFQFA